MGQSYGTDTGLRGSSFPGGQYYCMFVCWWGPRPSGEAALKTQGQLLDGYPCWREDGVHCQAREAEREGTEARPLLDAGSPRKPTRVVVGGRVTRGVTGCL